MSSDPDAEQLDRELRALAQVDLPPIAARALLVAAQRRLARREPPSSWLARQEPAFLLVLSAAHLAWALLHVLRP